MQHLRKYLDRLTTLLFGIASTYFIAGCANTVSYAGDVNKYSARVYEEFTDLSTLPQILDAESAVLVPTDFEVVLTGGRNAWDYSTRAEAERSFRKSNKLRWAEYQKGLRKSGLQVPSTSFDQLHELHTAFNQSTRQDILFTNPAISLGRELGVDIVITMSVTIYRHAKYDRVWTGSWHTNADQSMEIQVFDVSTGEMVEQFGVRVSDDTAKSAGLIDYYKTVVTETRPITDDELIQRLPAVAQVARRHSQDPYVQTLFAGLAINAASTEMLEEAIIGLRQSRAADYWVLLTDVYLSLLHGDVEQFERALSAAAQISSSPRLSRSVSVWLDENPKYSTPAIIQALASLRPNSYITLGRSARDLEVEANRFKSIVNSVVVIESGSVTGTGIVIAEDRYVLTNSHVIAKSNDGRVIFSDGASFPIQGVVRSNEFDLALVQVTRRGMEAAEFASSDAVAVGTPVFVIGNAKGLGISISGGILSAKLLINGRTFLQTDASMNPGNSGGPLVLEDTSVIGITTKKWVEPDTEGIGFAIPSEDVIQFVEWASEKLGVDDE